MSVLQQGGWAFAGWSQCILERNQEKNYKRKNQEKNNMLGKQKEMESKGRAKYCQN